MNIPINPEHVRSRRRKYGSDDNFMTMPSSRPEAVVVRTVSTQQPVRTHNQSATLPYVVVVLTANKMTQRQA